ncbi:MAG TPA: DUF6807 family protein [Chthonomonas sp.]|uniref:DUF6807 family protein n=1 Tax=Chthonomonas sp. TaxID=2282153 RepID=UPI002B4B704B|nr:DUF6807 family protein [Chthonomonas sp.]HLH81289.1 DUF6807 family protein [Chthonomonas sp.]
MLPEENPVTLIARPGRVEFWIYGGLFAVYRTSSVAPCGFTAVYAKDRRPVLKPNEAGIVLGIARENVDGFDFTPSSNSAYPKGAIVPLSTMARRGPCSVGLRQDSLWITPVGEPIIAETRIFRALPGPGPSRILDIFLHLRPCAGREIVFGNAPHDLLQLYIAEPFLRETGLARNSRGAIGIEQIHRRSAAWCGFVGVIQKETVGFALMDHPQNPFFPTDWNLSADGTLSPSPLLWSGFAQNLAKAISLRYRLIVHDGYVDFGWTGARLQDFAKEHLLGVP